MRKYLFFDIDNTLTSYKTRQIPITTLDAIDQLKANGHFVAIATGRSYYSTKAVASLAHIDHIVCSGGKGICLNGKLIEDEPLPFIQALTLIHECLEKDIPFGFLPVDEDCIYCFDERLKESKVRHFTKWIIDEQLDLSHFRSFHKIYILCTKENQDQLKSLNNITHFRYHPQFLSIQADEKYTGILKMIDLIQGDPNEIVVFGDEMNDIDMFQKAPFSIAVGNAIEPLKAIASYITETSDDDGIYLACKHFNWI